MVRCWVNTGENSMPCVIEHPDNILRCSEAFKAHSTQCVNGSSCQEFFKGRGETVHSKAVWAWKYTKYSGDMARLDTRTSAVNRIIITSCRSLPYRCVLKIKSSLNRIYRAYLHLLSTQGTAWWWTFTQPTLTDCLTDSSFDQSYYSTDSVHRAMWEKADSPAKGDFLMSVISFYSFFFFISVWWG